MVKFATEIETLIDASEFGDSNDASNVDDDNKNVDKNDSRCWVSNFSHHRRSAWKLIGNIMFKLKSTFVDFKFM